MDDTAKSADLLNENVENNSRSDNKSSFIMEKNTPMKESPLTIENISSLYDQKLAPTSAVMQNLRFALIADVKAMIITERNSAISVLKKTNICAVESQKFVVRRRKRSSDKPRNILVTVASPRLQDLVLFTTHRFNKANPKDTLNSKHVDIASES
ncbi:hypothetical protein EVAR_18230_1 [Eumeta japonica]|uniref:Uncharacterized protein n=1 Tax=Eumeta variegata TaxID=151549 RepID=A0A4C1UJF6_EUMVA|nr:hypothetical protein EVAR_18230_1 [Eumeta japonica]